jgi:ABC-type polysaccharide/polyol phosphate export permease
MTYVNIRQRQMPFVIRYVGDLLAYRHLAFSLVGSDLRSRFRRSRVGILWAIIQPLAFSMMIALVWGSVFNTEGYWQFAVYVFSGMIVWEYFTSVVSVSQDALINAEGYLKQTRVPFFIFQVRTPLTSMVIFLLGVVGLQILILTLEGLPPIGEHVYLIPVFPVVLLLFAVPLATILSIASTQFRDIKYISQILVQALFFLSPVMIGREILARPELEFLAYLNPMVPLIGLFRAPIIDGVMWGQTELITMVAWIFGLWVLAIYMSVRAGRRLIFAI